MFTQAVVVNGAARTVLVEVEVVAAVQGEANDGD